MTNHFNLDLTAKLNPDRGSIGVNLKLDRNRFPVLDREASVQPRPTHGFRLGSSAGVGSPEYRPIRRMRTTAGSFDAHVLSTPPLLFPGQTLSRDKWRRKRDLSSQYK
jgi:hypothetical protein